MPSLPVSRRRAARRSPAARARARSSSPGARWRGAGTPPRGRAAARSSPSAGRRPRRSSSSTSPARSAGRGSTGWPRAARVADAVARAGGATAPADTARDQPRRAARRRDAGGRAASGRPGRRRPAAGADGRSQPAARATVAELDALPGIGPVTAQKIVDYRAAHGGFRSVDDLDAIPGIGPARIEQLRDLVTRDRSAAWPTLLVVAACLGLGARERGAAPAVALVGGAGRAVAAARGVGRGSARPPAACRARPCPRRLVVGERATRRARPERARLARRAAPAQSTAVVTGPVRRTRFALRVPAEVRRFGGRALRERVLLELPLGRSPPQGAVLALARAVVDRARGPRTASTSAAGSRGAASTSSCAAATGASSAGAAGSVASPTGSARTWRGRSRPGSAASAVRCSPGSCSARTRGSPRSSATASRPPGLYHLLAVSGQNVAFLASASSSVLAWLLGISRLRRPRWPRSARSSRTCSRSAGSRRSSARGSRACSPRSPGCVSRPRDRWHFLALGAAVLLAWTPASLLEPGFQLSFAAVAAIFLLVPRLRARVLEGYPLPRWLREALAVSIACGVGDGADPLAPVRRRAGLRAARERARHAGDRAAARARPRSARCSSRSCRPPRSRSPG